MKSFARVFSMLFVLALAAGTLRADADTVTLKDGRVLKGHIVEERSATVVMLVGGTQRSFGRDFIAKIAYGDGPDAGGDQASAPHEDNDAVDQPGGPAATVPAVPGGDLLTALSVRYRVPLRDVAWVRAQGVPDADLSLVFMIAATAQVVPRRVVKLYLEGLSWDQIEAAFQMQPDDVYYQSDDGVDYPYYYYPGLDGWDGYGLGLGYGGVWGGGWRGNDGRGRGFGGGHHGGGSWGGGGRTPVGGGRSPFGSGSGGRTPLGGAASAAGGGGGGFHGGGGGSHGGGHN